MSFLESWGESLAFVVILVMVVAAAYFIQQKRMAGMSRAAYEMGFSFDAKGGGLGGDFLGLPLLARNSGLSNVMRGTVTTGDVVLLDCQVGSGKQMRLQTVACMLLSGKNLPAFELRPENIFHKIGGAFGYKDIDFELSETFSKNYLLRGQDERAIRAVFHPTVLMFFEQHTDWCVEGAGEWLAVYKAAKTVEPAKVRELVDKATQVAKAFS